jgi:protein-disulfide isomerase
MSHRSEEKTRLRAERETREQERATAQAHRRRLWTLAGVLGAALVAVVVIVLVASGGGDDGESAAERKRETAAVFSGVPQDGTSLGDRKARATLTEFADLQCPYCAQYAVQVLPQVVDRYVKTGQLRLELRMLRLLGPDSERGARAAQAAARQDRMWNFADAFYRAQGVENSGYVTDDFLTEVAQAAGVRSRAVLDAVNQNEYEQQLQAVDAEANEVGVSGTPTFVVQAKGGAPRTVRLQELSLEALEQELRPVLGR